MFRTKKSLGQHYLIDQKKLDRIADLVIKAGQNIVEIGPGTGKLTEYLFKNGAKQIIAIEKDDRFCEHLKALFIDHDFQLKSNDVLQEDFSQWPDNFVICGNLPYNISSVIITNFIKYISKFQHGIFLVQKELAEKICAKCGDRNYGRLSIFINSVATAKIVLNVPPGCFAPPPQVDSSVVHIQFQKDLVHQNAIPNQLEALDYVVKQAFSSPRKTIYNNFKNFHTDSENYNTTTQEAKCFKVDSNFISNCENILLHHNLNLQCRPNQIPIQAYLEMSQHIHVLNNAI